MVEVATEPGVAKFEIRVRLFRKKYIYILEAVVTARKTRYELEQVYIGKKPGTGCER